MKKYPKDDEQRKKGTRARALLPAMFDVSHWEYHEITGTDHGTDVLFEYIENDEFRGDKLEGQIKGRSGLKVGDKGIPFSAEIKTLNYGLACRNAYVFFLVDLETEEDAYYLPIQDYFIANPEYYDKMQQNESYYTIYFSEKNRVNFDDFELCEIAKSAYIMDENDRPKKVK